MNSSERVSNRYEIMKGTFLCQQCGEEAYTSRVYKDSLDVTWKCKNCEHVSTVSLYYKRGY